MSFDDELSGALRSATRTLNVRELRKAKVDNVRVIERSQLIELLGKLKQEGASSDEDAAQRRVERLLQENAKLGKEKKELEHAKGLVEAERGRLQAAVDEVCQALGREAGEKLQEQDIRELLAERARLRAQIGSLEKNLKRLQTSARERLDEELGRNADLEGNLGSIQSERDKLERERDRLESEVEALRHDLEQFRDERDRTVDERDAMASEREQLRQERDGMRRERDQFREERDTYLKRCASLAEDLTALRAQAEAARREAAELHQAREADAKQLAELTLERAQLAERVAELEPKAEPEPEVVAEEPAAPAPAKAAEPDESRRSTVRRAKQEFGAFGFGFGPGHKGR
ncbi:MAG: hypothetical protein AB7N76_33790 [Planctomycetota bacterium]